jgi:hypothetical protein
MSACAEFARVLGETHQLRRLLLAHNHISDASASVR